jgi:hypothetical protein
MEAKTLFLHVGITKTGSSYLQSCLALNSDLLAQHGIDYCSLGLDSQFFDKAREGRLIMGNGRQIVSLLSEPNDSSLLDDYLKDAHTRLLNSTKAHISLFSDEGLCAILSHENKLKRFARAAYEAGYTNVKVLLLLRNPYEHMCSWYLEQIRGNGRLAAHMTIDQYACSYNNLSTYRRLINGLSDNNISLRCHNYSLRRKDLLKIALDWFGLDSSTVLPLLSLPKLPVNRSLDYVEQEVCKALIKEGIKPAVFTKVLLYETLYSSGKPSIPYVDPKALAQLREKNQPDLEIINSYLPDSEPLVFDKTYFPAEPILSLEATSEQIEAITTSFVSILRKYNVIQKKWKIE